MTHPNHNLMAEAQEALLGLGLVVRVKPLAGDRLKGEFWVEPLDDGKRARPLPRRRNNDLYKDPSLL